MDIYKGLTFRKGEQEVNVHSCKDGIVYYGHYRDGDDWPTDLHQAPIDVFSNLAENAVEHGATAFSLLPANAELEP